MTRTHPEPQDAPPGESKDIVVFIIRRDTKCAECGEELGSGRWIRIENEKALCMTCADLAHLEYLPSGNTALTRRATKHSPLRAVVVQWARARKRYERQGILITAEALRLAEEECLADEDHGKAEGAVPGLSAEGGGAHRNVDLSETFRPRRTFGGGERFRAAGPAAGGHRSHPARTHPLRRTPHAIR